MKMRYYGIATLMIVAAAAAFAWLLPDMPPRVPVHWNAHGDADRFGSPWELLLVGPGAMAAIAILFSVLPWLSPRRFQVEAFERTYLAVMLMIVALVGYVFAVMVWAALHGPVGVLPAAGAKNVPVRRVAPEETIEAARALWREGAHEAAVTTLREAMAGAQSPGNGAAASQLARELARFEIADNHVQAALDLLKGHEAALHADAEAWALRGNAEQRLALHSDAADSYQMALRLRPGQGKWMLGAAISLAAQGHRGEAQAWVDQAQARGAVTPAIATYLRQLGLDTH